MKKKIILFLITIIMTLTCYAHNGWKKISNPTRRAHLEIELKNKLKVKGIEVINYIKKDKISDLKKEISPLIVNNEISLIKKIKLYTNSFKYSDLKLHDIYYYRPTKETKETKLNNSNSDDISLNINFFHKEQASLIYKSTNEYNNSHLFIITFGKYNNDWKLAGINIDLYTINGMTLHDIYLLGKQLMYSDQFFTGATYLSAVLKFGASSKKVSYTNFFIVLRTQRYYLIHHQKTNP